MLHKKNISGELQCSSIPSHLTVWCIIVKEQHAISNLEIKQGFGFFPKS